MKLVNTTPLAADINISSLGVGLPRLGVLRSKATYRYEPSGALALDTQTPLPLFKKDEACGELGFYPDDNDIRQSDEIELFVLGAAHSRGRPVDTLRVGVSLAGQVRELFVYGDRVWNGSGGSATISAPVPFSRMPITWDRAFGGAARVYVDAKNAVPVSHPWNALGKGFDTAPHVESIAKFVGAESGYPLLSPGYVRALPNIEDPANPVRRYEDDPLPLCWAPTPREIGMMSWRAAEVAKNEPALLEEVQALIDEGDTLELLAPDKRRVLEVQQMRSHPTMAFAIHAAQVQQLVLFNLDAEKERVTLNVPSFAPVFDFIIGETRGELPATLKSITINTDERLIALTFKAFFNMDESRRVERSFRMRYENDGAEQ